MSGPLQSWRVNEADLRRVGTYISEELASSTVRPFILWLQGDLGAGKTTLAGHILRGLGLSEMIPVLSPTFTYLTEYQTPLGLIAHMDLYRLVEGDEDSVHGFLDGRGFAGVIVEWPERALTSEYLSPTYVARITFDSEPDFRAIEFFKTVLR